MRIDDTANYPRPDFVRENYQMLNGIWEFSFDTDIFDREILVPFVYQSKQSGIGIQEEHEIVWYRRTFHIEGDSLNQRRTLLKFGAVDYKAFVYINGSFVGHHVGGHTSFALDITDYVHAGENEIKVKVEDGRETDKPRGKQSWTGDPFGCWYTASTGIWQDVWVEYTSDVYVKRIKLTPDLEKNMALCEVFISDNRKCQLSIRTVVDSVVKEELLDLGTNLLGCENGYGKCVIAFPDFDHKRDDYIWSLHNPNLIYVTVELQEDLVTQDKVMTYFGMRSVEFKNNQFYLNGHVCMQRLVLDQGYWEDTLLTPFDDEALIKDIHLAKEMGFNGVRKHQKIESPKFYYWADKMGFLVWGELPSSYCYTDNTIERTVNEMMEFLERDFNHPSIIVWVPVNESWGIRNVRKDVVQQNYVNMMIFLIKSMDSSRYVSGNDGWEQTEHTDIIALHDYTLMPSTLHRYDDMENVINGAVEQRPTLAIGQSYNGQPIMMTEYGGVAFAAEEDGWGYYGKVDSEETFLNRIAPITEFLIKSGKFAGFCYTQLTDVMQEKNGLLYADREPKVSLEKLRKIFDMKYYEE